MNRPPVVLMYHGVDDLDSARDPENLFVRVAAFKEQMRLVQRAGYDFVSEDDYIAWLDGRPLRRPSVLLTFDDGYLSVLRHAAPVLSPLGLPAVCYVCPGLLGGRSTWMPQAPWHELMDADQLADLRDAGFSLGVHGHDHTALHMLTLPELQRHTKDAAQLLQQRVGVSARTFAYPYGYHSPAARQAASSAGFDAAFAIYDAAGRWALPRVDVNAVDTPRTFRLKLSSVYPATRRVLSVAPPVRRAVHVMVGRPRR